MGHPVPAESPDPLHQGILNPLHLYPLHQGMLNSLKRDNLSKSFRLRMSL